MGDARRSLFKHNASKLAEENERFHRIKNHAE